MSGFETIAAVVGIVFVVGTVFGILLVMVLPVLRSVLRERRRRQYPADGNGWKSRLRNVDDGRAPRWPGA